MSQWLEANVIRYLTAFQLIMFLFYLFGMPFSNMIVFVVTSGTYELFMIFIFAAYALVLCTMLLVGLGVYQKDKDVKQATIQNVEMTPAEVFTIKQAISLIQGLSGLKGEQYVPKEEPEKNESKISSEDLRRIIKEIEDKRNG